ncbi:hypothetical protein ACFL2Q_16875 [Thermodesulfobacteriota bacterium]
MNKGYLIAAIILFAVSIVCVIAVSLETIGREFGMLYLDFWGGVLFHAVSAIVASFLLVKAHKLKPRAR